MSNPFPQPDPSSQDSGSGWSSQSSTPPQSPYGQSPYGQSASGQNGWTQGQDGWTQGQDGASSAQSPYAASYAQQAQVDQIRSNSTVILVLGILGLVIIGLFGSVPAWIWGNSTVKKAQAMGLPGYLYQNATIGKVLGIIGTVLWAIATAFLVFFVVLAIVGTTTYHSTEGYTMLLSLLG